MTGKIFVLSCLSWTFTAAGMAVFGGVFLNDLKKAEKRQKADSGQKKSNEVES